VEQLDILTRAVIATLKEFSNRKETLTFQTLKEALLAKQDIISLLHDISTHNGNKELPSAEEELSYAIADRQEKQSVPDDNYSPEFRDLFLRILNGLAPFIRNEHEDIFSHVLDNINECHSLSSLLTLAEIIVTLTHECVDNAILKLDHSNDFFVELNRYLYDMEEQLSSYQNYNRDTNNINDDFNADLLSHANEMHKTLNVLNVEKNIHDIRNIITTKLNTISKAIEVKRQSDEIRLQEADSKINELQNNLKTYKLEIIQVREKSESLEKEILLDELTQINNRRAYKLQIKDNLRRYRQNGEKFSLILIDVDHFKQINDNFGHKAGDKCLKELAGLIKSSLRQTDFIARYGGEELIVILDKCDVTSAAKVAEKIRRRIEGTLFTFQETIIPVTISAGVTAVIDTDAEPETPFIRVDQAMYQAKKLGRNRIYLIAGNSEIDN